MHFEKNWYTAKSKFNINKLTFQNAVSRLTVLLEEFNEVISRQNTIHENLRRNLENLNRSHSNSGTDLNSFYDSLSSGGLTNERISKFNHFTADESHVGSTCWICREDLQVGTQMVRLDCPGHHVMCKACTMTWFADKDTCPMCRTKFSWNFSNKYCLVRVKCVICLIKDKTTFCFII